MEKSGCDIWSDSPDKVKSVLLESGELEIAREDIWRVKFLKTLLEQRQEWHYLGDQHEEDKIQKLIDSLCVN